MDYKKQATFNEYTISVLKDNSIEVLINGNLYNGEVKPLLQDTIAPQIEFDVEEKWTTRDIGRKMIEYLNQKKIKKIPNLMIIIVREFQRCAPNRGTMLNII